MATSMKARILASVSKLLAETNDLAMCERQLTRLAELGAPESLIANSAARHTAMREELPRLISYIEGTFKNSDSLNRIQAGCGMAGFSTEALYAIRSN